MVSFEICDGGVLAGRIWFFVREYGNLFVSWCLCFEGDGWFLPLFGCGLRLAFVQGR